MIDLDLVAAWLLVGLITAAPKVVYVIPAAAAGAIAVWAAYARLVRQLRRELVDQRTVSDDLSRKLADAHTGRRQAEEAAVAYQHRAGREHSRAAAYAARARELAVELQRATSVRPDLRVVIPEPDRAEDLVAVAAAAGVLVDQEVSPCRP